MSDHPTNLPKEFQYKPIWWVNVKLSDKSYVRAHLFLYSWGRVRLCLLELQAQMDPMYINCTDGVTTHRGKPSQSTTNPTRTALGAKSSLAVSSRWIKAWARVRPHGGSKPTWKSKWTLSMSHSRWDIRSRSVYERYNRFVENCYFLLDCRRWKQKQGVCPKCWSLFIRLHDVTSPKTASQTSSNLTKT